VEVCSFTVISFKVISFKVISFKVISFKVISFKVISFEVITFKVISFEVISFEVISQTGKTFAETSPVSIPRKVNEVLVMGHKTEKMEQNFFMPLSSPFYRI